jgi:hypothetical protein
VAAPPPRPAPASRPVYGPKPYVPGGAANRGGYKAPPAELYITAFRKGEGDQEKISFGLSVGSAGYEKWGLDQDHWYNMSFWFNLDQLRDFLNSNDPTAKNIGKGKMYDPKPREARR